MLNNIFGTPNVILERLLGISKATFVKEKVVPANDNDVFNDNKCTFCWGPYDEDHPAARVLPCNHVFGRDCLTQIIDAPNGDHCPVCRTSLFRPDLHVAVRQWLADGLMRMLLCLIMATYKLSATIDQLGNTMGLESVNQANQAGAGHPLQWYLQQISIFYLNSNNIMYYAKLVSENFTHLRVRNPQLDLSQTMFFTWLPTWQVHRYYLAYLSSSTMLPQPLQNTLSGLVSVFFTIVAIIDVYDKLTNHKDLYLFAVVVLLSAIIQFFVRTIMVALCPFLL